MTSGKSYRTVTCKLSHIWLRPAPIKSRRKISYQICLHTPDWGLSGHVALGPRTGFCWFCSSSALYINSLLKKHKTIQSLGLILNDVLTDQLPNSSYTHRGLVVHYPNVLNSPLHGFMPGTSLSNLTSICTAAKLVKATYPVISDLGCTQKCFSVVSKHGNNIWDLQNISQWLKKCS